MVITMTINSNLVFAEMGDGFVAVPVGDAAKRIVIRLNKTGKDICNALVDGLTTDEIVRSILNEYEGVDEETARKGVESVVSKLRDAGLISE